MSTLSLLARVSELQAALRLDFEPALLPGREKQSRALRDFLAAHVQAGATGGSLYLSGRPGTGKVSKATRVHAQAKLCTRGEE